MTKIIAYTGAGAHFQAMILSSLFSINPFGRGYGKITDFVSIFFDSNNSITAEMQGNFNYAVQLNDYYWTRIAFGIEQYEPEVGALMDLMANKVPTFVDCGANKGYWTARAASQFAEVIAIEASPSTFQFLQQNGEHDNVTLVNAALSSKSGHAIEFIESGKLHAAARIQSDSNNDLRDDERLVSVSTVCLDDLVEGDALCLIKLDVEGAEIEALKGAQGLLSNGSCVVYEDHGSDTACAVSQYLLAIEGIALFGLEGGISRIKDVQEIVAQKSNPNKGYNFAAIRCDSVLFDIINALTELKLE